MVDPGRGRTRLAPLALGLALWSALPSFEWCPFTWQDCWKACEAAAAAPACAAACGSIPAGACRAECGPISAGACGPMACAGRNLLRVLPCDREPDPLPFGDRAWCIHAPIEGVPIRGLDLLPLDAGSLIYGAVEAPRLRPPARAASRRLEVATTCPALHAPHAPPQSRAPPSA